MSVSDEIMKAIGAHGSWKLKLKTAVTTGKSDVNVSALSQDNQCEFGKWLYSLQGNMRQSAEWKSVQKLHADFHKEAGLVLDLALKGQKAEAEKRIANGGAFDKVSKEIAVSLAQWKNKCE